MYLKHVCKQSFSWGRKTGSNKSCSAYCCCELLKKMCAISVTGDQGESVREEWKVEAGIFKVLQISETASYRVVRKTKSPLPKMCSFIVPSL